MTREEQIEKAVSEVLEERQTAVGRKKYGGWYFVNWFKEGVKWADEHPKSPWISVDEDLPCNHDELIHFGFTNNVLVIDDKQNTSIAFMKKYKDNEWIWDSTNDFVFLPLITHWMLIPKLSKE